MVPGPEVSRQDQLRKQWKLKLLLISLSYFYSIKDWQHKRALRPEVTQCWEWIIFHVLHDVKIIEKIQKIQKIELFNV